MMKTVWLLSMLMCRGLGSTCPEYYEVYPTRAQCEVALSKWKESGGWWFASGIRNGYCLQRELSPEDIQVYHERRYYK